MKYLKTVSHLLQLVMTPLRSNWAFFTFIYLLGCICAWVTLPDARGAKLYDNLYPELFLDVYVLATILTILPRRVKPWIRGFFYFVLYTAAVVDVYCFVKFQSTLTPTMLLLVGETDSREAGEFIRSCVSPDILISGVGWVLLLMAVHILTAIKLRFPHFVPRNWCRLVRSILVQSRFFLHRVRHVTEFAVLALLVFSIVISAHNKAATLKLMTGKTIGDVEHTLTEKDHAVLYQPIYRLVFSIYANTLTAKQVDKLIATADKVRVDSCSFTSPNIVLIIGESYNRHHSSQYGYVMPTAPRQTKLEHKGRLVKYTDVVSPWNLTSFVFKHIFSLYTVGDKGEWCDYPLFPELFRKAGYHVTFITNQFLPKAKEAVYDFSGGFFLNNPKLSAAQFDTRNTELHQYDEGLLEDYDKLQSQDTENNLIIFHLLGQHVSYRQRSPKDRKKFYNDSIVTEIVKKFENKDAIVIYVPDHGEECFEGDMHFFCRMHSAKVDARLAHAEFDIPMWIWCSRKYIRQRPEIFREVMASRNKRYMTDALPHMLLYLAGISCPEYKDRLNLLSPAYDETRPRILKNSADYDKLK